MKKPSEANAGKSTGGLVLLVVVLCAVLSVFFWQSFSHNKVLYSNDGPLGLVNAQANRLPSGFFSLWWDLGWLGNEGISPSPNLSGIIGSILGPLYFSKFYCPLAILTVGLAAWFCFRRLKLAPAACFIGGLAAGLNSDFFSTSCWGVCATVIGIGMSYFALGFLADNTGRKRWLGVLLGGLAVGMGVMEAFDIGAIFSLFIAAFVVYQSLFLKEGGTMAGRMGTGAVRLVLVGVFAAFIAVHTLSVLVDTQIKGVAGQAQDPATKARAWEDKTLYSQPKAEMLSVAVPGLFGFRTDWYMYDDDQPQADRYWGGLPDPVGTGNYVGVGVVVIALWGLLQSFRREKSPFTLLQRRAMWFWLAMLLVAALLSFGRYAPFYQLFYALPYASTIRNPVKFMHVFSWILEILFAYGVHGLWMVYLREPATQAGGFAARFRNWWTTGAAFDRRWLVACAGLIIASLVGWLVYASRASSLQTYLAVMKDPYGQPRFSPELVPAMTTFSQQAVGWYLLFLFLTVAWLALSFSGQFAGPRARWGLALFSVLLVFDLARADRPWISYWDTDYKYQADPIIDVLADKPYEHRVGLLPLGPTSQQDALLQRMYASDWKQGLFWYNNIQCVDVAQEPRTGVDKIEFMNAFPFGKPVLDTNGRPVLDARGQPAMQLDFAHVFRFWELSNTRYFFCPAGDFIKSFTRQLDPTGQRFRVLKTFNFAPKRANPGPYPVDYHTVLDPNGQLALVEFTGALPRASLIASWQIETNDAVTLETIASTNFDPHQKVLVADSLAGAPTPGTGANQSAGTVEIKPDYAPKRIELAADVKVPSVLLLCDRYNPKWEVTVDDKPETLLRCNFIERGVFLKPGQHKVVFRFVPPATSFYISLVFTVPFFLGLIYFYWMTLQGAGEETPAPEPAAGQPGKA